MHQTFYIDIDEEITSVIDRIRKSRLKRLIFVIPQRALVLQSVVNLKLLKRQAERMKKQIMIISQDEQTRTIAEKVGISFQTSMQGISEETEYKGRGQIMGKSRTDIMAKDNIINLENKNSSRSIGSAGYYDSKKESEAEQQDEYLPERIAPKQSAGREENNDYTSESLRPAGNMLPNPQVQKAMASRPPLINRPKRTIGATEYQGKSAPSNDWKRNEALPKDAEKFITSIYNPQAKEDKKTEKAIKVPVGKGIGKTLIFFGIFALIIIAATLAYFLMPKPKVTVFLKSQNIKFNFEATAKISETEANLRERLIPAIIIEQEIKKNISYNASGSADGKEKRSSGRVVIYNEYSTEEQTLVATTRLITSEGKLFRLTKGVTVPGMARIGNETKPGVVEAEVSADQPGVQYNIGPSQFKIPGFEGSPKYDKFYAKSEAAMVGGGSSESEIHVISKNDLAAARSKAEQEIRKTFLDDIKKGVHSGSLLIEESAEIGEVLVTCPQEGQIAESFECTASAPAKAFAVNNEDLKKLAIDTESKSGSNFVDFSESSEIPFKFSNVKNDYANKTVSFKTEGEGISKSGLDSDKVKKELAGMGRESVPELLKKYPQVGEIVLDFGLNFFMKKIPSETEDYILEIKQK